MKSKPYNLKAPSFEEIFKIEGAMSKFRVFDPELRGREIVLPVEFTKTDGEIVTLGFTLDRKHLRDLFETYDFDEVIG